jgi:hypothetical protein
MNNLQVYLEAHGKSMQILSIRLKIRSRISYKKITFNELM